MRPVLQEHRSPYFDQYCRGLRLGLLLGIFAGLAVALIDVSLMLRIAEWMR